DPQAASAAFMRAGFAPTPVSIQVNPDPAGGAPRLTGTGNVTAMLSRGYIETLFKTADTPLARELDAAITRYPGVHLAAFAVADAAAAHRRLAKSFRVRPLAEMQRPVELDRGRVERMSAEVFAHTLPELAIPSLPFAGAYGIKVKSLAVLKDILHRAGVKIRRREQTLIAPFPEELGQGAWMFSDAA